MTTVNYIIMFFAVAGFMTLLTRMKYIIDHPEKVIKNDDGTIKWAYLFFINSVELIIGGTVGAGIGVVVEYYAILEGNMLFIAVALSGLVGGKIFEAVQKKLHAKIDEKLDQWDF